MSVEEMVNTDTKGCESILAPMQRVMVAVGLGEP